MNIWFDLKYATRLLFKAPGHTFLCVVVVALSVGLAQFAWELAYSQAFEPLPFAGSDRWWSVQIAANPTVQFQPNIDAYTYQELREHTRSIDHLGAFAERSVVLSETNASVGLLAAAISPELFAAMKVPPAKGRLFDATEAAPGATPVAVLSFDTWQNYFAGDPSIVGRQARIDGVPVQIIGVMPHEFFAFQDYALWMPLQLPKLTKPGDSTVMLSALIKVRDDQNIGALSREIGAAVGEVTARHSAVFNSGRNATLIAAHQMNSYGNLEIVVTINFVALAVLVLGGVNISLIFLARMLERSRELALRTALGSSRWRLLRQSLLESFLIIAIGVLVAWVLVALGLRWANGIAEFGARVLATGRTANVPTLRPVDLLVAGLAATALWLLSTLIPAWRISKQDVVPVLAGSGKGVAAAGATKSAGVLVSLQVAVSCLVLVLCTNLSLSVHDEVSKPTNIKSAGVMMSVYPTALTGALGERYSEAAERVRYWDELTGAILGRVAGAEVAYATGAPSRAPITPIAVELREGSANQGTLTSPVSAVSNGYFDLLGIRVREGRLFDGTDDDRSLGVALVDENMARRYWPNDGALGKRVQINPAENGPWLTIVGVVSPVGGRPYRRDLGMLYRPLRQAVPSSFFLLARLPPAAADPRALLRAAAHEIDRDLPLHNLQMLDEYLAAMNLNFVSLVPVFLVLAAITVMLAATGVFGLISRSVARRTQEVGVRRALGGTQWQVSMVFLRQGAIYSSVGIVGGALGIFVTEFLSNSVPNILVFIVPVAFCVLIFMAFVIFVASYLPTRRAVALEPGDALHYE